MLREVVVSLAAVTWWTLGRIRFPLAILVGWWAAIGLGLSEPWPHPLLIPGYLAWGFGAWASIVWLWAARVVGRAWLKQHFKESGI